MTATIGFNHLFVDARPLTGPGYYAVQLLENVLRLIPQRTAPTAAKVFVQQGTRHHYSPAAQACLVELPAERSRYGRVISEQFRLPHVARREGIDLLFSPGFVSPLFGAPLKFVTIHDMYYRVFPAAVERNQLRYWRAMLPITSRVCDRLLTVSQSSRRDIERYLPAARGKVIVTPLASRFEPLPSLADEPDSAAPPFILMVANLTPNKNVRRVLEALEILRAGGRDVELVHIGSDHRGELAQGVAEKGLADRVRSLGKVDDATLVATTQASLCVVVPSLYEGFGLPAIEAQALGAAVICSDRGSLPEVVGDSALTFDPEDPEALARAIVRLLDEPGLRQDLRRRGLQNAGRFSWRRTAELTLEAFETELRAKGLL